MEQSELKKCIGCESFLSFDHFERDGRTKDFLSKTCITCNKEAPIITRKPKLFKSSEEEQRLILRVTDLYNYLSTLKTVEGYIVMKKSIPQIIEFFDFNPQLGIDLIYSFIESTEQGYRWTKLPSSAEEVALSYRIVMGMAEPRPIVDIAALYDQFLALREEVFELTESVKKIIKSFNV